MAKKIDIDYWKQIHDFTFAKFSWDQETAVFHYGFHVINSISRELLDILHTGLDGHTVNPSGKKEIKYVLHPDLLNTKFKTARLAYDIVRTNFAWAFVERGLATPTDYLHIIKIHLIGNGDLPMPKYWKKAYEKTELKKTLDDLFELVKYEAERIFTDVYLKHENLSIKNLFPIKKIQTKTGKGKLKNNPNDTPKHIIESAHLMLTKNRGIGYAQSLFARANGKRKKVSRNTFYKDWDKFKFPALRYILLKYAHEELLLTETKQKYWKSRLFLYVEQRKVDSHYQIILYFNDETINRIRKSWELETLPQECNISASFSKLDFRKKDFFDKKLPYPTIYFKL